MRLPPFLIPGTVAIGLAVPAVAVADRPMGHVFDWSHELSQRRLPQWDERTAPPVPPARWNRTIDGLMTVAGRNGLWFSGYHALPFDIPRHPRDPGGWRTPATLSREFAQTGLRWDVNLEARAAAKALNRRWAVVADRTVSAPTRRLTLIDPGYERAATSEIRRLASRYASLPYVFAYTGSDEPVAVLPRGRAVRSATWQRLVADMRRQHGWAPPAADAAPTGSVTEALRWSAYSRFSGDRFFAMKARQSELIHRLDPDAIVIPNNHYFIDGFVPWDYTRLGAFADIVEADPYVSLAERRLQGRGRYNPGFGAKLMADLTGRPVRVIVQAFRYAGYTPTPDDLEAWTAQALRAGGTHISFYALGNPRFTNRPLYERMLGLARRLRSTRLPDAPSDAATVVVYATASEGQAQPRLTGEVRSRTAADALYTTYATLGELGHGEFTFDSDRRLVAEPERLARARLIWLPRGETLDRAFAERLAEWVRAGGTLIATDAGAFTRAIDGSPLAEIRANLVGAGLGAPRVGGTLQVDVRPLDASSPSPSFDVPIAAVTRGFTGVPDGAEVIGRLPDGTPAAIVRPVGSGRVVAFATNPMRPAALTAPAALVRLVTGLQRFGGGRLDHPAWTYRVPGATGPERSPWPGAYRP